jgi:DNA-binding CsgD family transcriptional regulator/PAS domain-containing protein
VTGLREQDVRAVLNVVGEANDAQDLAEYRAVVTASLLRLVPAEFSAYNEMRGAGTVVAAISEPPILEPWAHEAWGRYGAQNPLFQRFLETRDGRAYRFSDVIAPADLHRLELYRALYQRLGVEHQVAFILPSTADLVVAIALSRGAVDFSVRECDMLNLARPHLAQAFRNARLRERAAQTVVALRRGLDAGGEAIVVLDDQGLVMLASSPALALLAAAGEPAPQEEQPLAGPLGTWSGADPLILGAGADRVVARRLDGTPTVLVLQREGRAIPLTALRRLGLTPREAEVLAGFMRGRDTMALATELTLSPRTVHKHAERIRAKLSARSRGEAVAAAWAAVDRAR